MRVIKIKDSKIDKLSDYVEKMLKYGGKVMSCVEEFKDSSRHDDDDDDDDDYFGMRENDMMDNDDDDYNMGYRRMNRYNRGRSRGRRR